MEKVVIKHITRGDIGQLCIEEIGPDKWRATITLQAIEVGESVRKELLNAMSVHLETAKRLVDEEHDKEVEKSA